MVEVREIEKTYFYNYLRDFLLRRIVMNHYNLHLLSGLIVFDLS